MELEILTYPDPALRRVARPLERIDDEVRARAKRMLELMYAGKGVGLAAPQVGWSVRLIVANPTGKPEDERIFINPEVRNRRGREVGVEGCLSLPEITGKIERAKKVELAAYDLDGREFKLDLDDFAARVIQHECDHLEGILIIDRMSPAERSRVERNLRELIRRRNELEAADGHKRGVALVGGTEAPPASGSARATART